ncbi:hypothetical protein ES705_16387 [subsurface metagenome]
MRISKESREKIGIIKAAYEKEGRLTVRRIYYILLSRGFFDLTKSDNPEYAHHIYQNLSNRLVDWREAGLVDPDIIVDRKSELIRRPTHDNFQEAFDELLETYSRNSMLDQKRHIEVWIEKDTMRNTFIEDCYFNDVPLIVGKGWTSYTFKHEAVKRFKKYYPKPVMILAFGDFDMEGEHIPEVIKKFILDKIPDLDFELKKVLLTPADYNRLSEFAIRFKPTRKQLEHFYAREFIDKHGPIKLEVEAMPFDETKRRFRQALFKQIDKRVVDDVENTSEGDKRDWLENHYKK